jgi:hypothetical protein
MKSFTVTASDGPPYDSSMNNELLGNIRELVADPTKAPAMQALLQAEAERVIQAMRDESFAADVPYSDEELARRVAAYEALTEDLARAGSLVAYWSRTTDERLVPTVITRLVNSVERTGGVKIWLDLMLYPAVLELYGAGLGAVIGRREEQLALLLGETTVRQHEEWKPIALVLNGAAAIDHNAAKRLPGLEKRHTPISDHLCDVMRPWVEELEPDQGSYERMFDRWEYVLGLAMFDMTRQGVRNGYAPVGRLSWRGNYGNGIEVALGEETQVAGANWPPLRAGLFGGDATRLAESVKGWHELIASVRSQQW